MKSKLLILSFLMSLTFATNYAQISATQAGIAIQGIARDANNTAIASENISFTFKLYYKDNSSIEQTIFEESKSIMTDAFGVFSYIIDPTATNSSKFANNIAYLRITKGAVIISDEKLNHVPYAIAANNGVPTGSIMPYIGTTAPEGWLLCDGLTNVPQPSALYDLIGSTTPNLKGMFLRGTGISPENGQAGPALKTRQGDEFKSHNHGVADNGHNHSYNDIYYSENGGSVEVGGTGSGNSDGDNKGFQISRISDKSTTGISVNHFGGTETRPVNYGVNYIIKL
jgi:hypothetical protein